MKNEIENYLQDLQDRNLRRRNLKMLKNKKKLYRYSSCKK